MNKIKTLLIVALMGLGLAGLQAGPIQVVPDQLLKHYQWRLKAVMRGDYKVGLARIGASRILDQNSPPPLVDCNTPWQVQLPPSGVYTITASSSNCDSVLDTQNWHLMYTPNDGSENWQPIGDAFSLRDVYARTDPTCCASSSDCIGEYKPGLLPAPGCSPTPTPTATPANPCGSCPTFSAPQLPGRYFRHIESHGGVVSTTTADCSGAGCESGPCNVQTTCTGSGAVMSVNPATCEITDTAGTWNSTNTSRSVCVNNVCATQSPSPPVNGTYHADSISFCGLNIANYTYTVQGTSIHGNFVDDHQYTQCSEHDTSTYDVYYDFSDECFQ